MTTVKALIDQIWEVEGICVVVSDEDGGSANRRKAEDYPYERAAKDGWTVAKWRAKRFEENWPEFTVQVVDPEGNVVHGKTLLSTVREFDWSDHDDAPGPGRDEEPAETEEPEPTTSPSGGMTRQDLEGRLWEAANILRGPVDPANLRDFVFPLMFLKRLSDSWDEEHAKAVAEWGDDLDDDIESDFHKFQIPAGCHWADVRRAAENHGVVLLRVMQKIEEANPDRLSQIFGNAPWADHNKMPPERLERLVDYFSQLDLSPEKVSNDLLGGGYEYLLKRFSDESATSAGQFFTPRAVVHLIVRILAPGPTDSVYDPACGSAGMLIEAATEVVQSGGSVRQMRFYGQEVNQTSAAIGRMNLLIHNVEDAKILRDDTLRNPRFVDDRGRLEQFDVVVANPPFSLKNWGADEWGNDPHRRAIGGIPPRGNGDFAWVQHMVASMKPGEGRLGVVMPHGVLFRGGAEARIRQHLIEADLLEAVVGLAPNLFYGTVIPACLLFFNTNKPEFRKAQVLFVDGVQRFTKGRNQNELSTADVDDLFAVCTSGGKDERNAISARLVGHGEIAANSFDLNLGRYLMADTAEVVDVAGALAELEESRKALAEAEVAMIERLRAAGYA